MMQRIWRAYTVEIIKAIHLRQTYVAPLVILLAILLAPLGHPLQRDGLSDYAFIAYSTPMALNLLGFLLLLTYCAGLISSELNSGAIRSILVRPIRRWEFVCAKLLAGLSYALLLTLLTGLLSWALAQFFGDLIGVSYGGEVLFTREEMIQAYLFGALLSLLPQFAGVAYALFISTLVRNPVGAVSLTLGAWLGIDVLKYPLHIERFVFTTYLDSPWQVFINRCDGIAGTWFPEAAFTIASLLQRHSRRNRLGHLCLAAPESYRMIALLLSITLTALTFESQDLPGLRVGPPATLSGEVAANCRHLDLNGDALTDLLLADAAWLKNTEKGFSQAAPFPPAFHQAGELDLWGATLYLRNDHALCTYNYENNTWKKQLEFAFHWPDAPQKTLPITPNQETSHLRLSRFLYDNDQDGQPELLCIHPEGVSIYTITNKGIALLRNLQPYPPMRIEPQPSSDTAPKLWPPQARRLTFPERHMRCQLLLEAGSLLLLEQHPIDSQQINYHFKTFSLDPQNTTESPLWQSRPLPLFLRPCRLNEDTTPDFAGSRWQLSNAAPGLPLFQPDAKTNPLSPAALPIYEIWASFDGGDTFHIRRCKTFYRARPHCAFIDVDGDGDKDLITESVQLFERGLREAFIQIMTRNALDHELCIYKQINRSFSRDPEIRHQSTLRLDAPPQANSPFLQRYQAGELINLTGDFNGDGYRDLAVQHTERSIAIYLADKDGFPSQPDATLGLRKPGRFSVFDVDNDGKSDLLLRWFDEHGQSGPLTTVYFLREKR